MEVCLETDEKSDSMWHKSFSTIEVLNLFLDVSICSYCGPIGLHVIPDTLLTCLRFCHLLAGYIFS
jgi:hypothetical protein